MDAFHSKDVSAAAGCFMLGDEDDLLNFSLDDDEVEEKGNKNSSSFLQDPCCVSSSNTKVTHQEDDLSRSSSFPVSLI